MSSSHGALRRFVTAINGNRLVRAAKDARNDLIDRRFRASGHEERDRFLGQFKPKSGFVVFAIAFNTPWVVDLLTAAWGKYVTDADLVVVDNSKKPEARARHRDICLRRNIAYCELPPNPEWNPNRSHAISMNWIYYNLVRRIQPDLFGFVDHDCFPVAPVSPARWVEGKTVFGLRLKSLVDASCWYLWAGFCFFDFGKLKDRAFNFKHDYPLRMDTGGKNWQPVYSTLTADQAGAAGEKRIEDDGLREHILADTFNHIGSVSYRSDLRDDERRRKLSEFMWDKYIGVDVPRIAQP
ncbi:MAG: hypothetical protein EKK40_06005 [Bradyrhizobiaceae bacterium]|nr:MAG: hypothetical protein EKK40_06005 [Bradyrhizobiaceae bacterium]